MLQVFAYSETSKILRLLTEQYGLRSVIAKGAQRPKSRFGGVLELFTEGIAHVYLREGRDLHTLGGFDLVRSRQELGRDLSSFAGASLVCEIALRFATEEPAPSLFAVISAALAGISDSPSALREVAVIGSVWSTISLLGFQPELHSCVSCGTPMEASQTTRFDVEAGGVACFRCRPSGRLFDATSRDELLAMVQGIEFRRPFSAAPMQRALLKAFLNVHLFQEHPLRSLDLFLRQLP